jgi:catechol 2,3-dioxygenase-like lactoylglutathione lyase family enzyme
MPPRSENRHRKATAFSRTGYVAAMIDHIGIAVGDLDRALAFYTKALAPLGYEVVMKWEKFVGFGIGGKPDFWIDGRTAPKDVLHVAFRAKGRAEVRAFYEAAMAAGGRDNGAPGVRPHYHEHYYGAFVIDPAGHNVEAVCHEAFLG